MGFLTEIPVSAIMTDKGKIMVNPAFDVVLEIQKLFREELTETEKLDISLRMLVQNNWNLRMYTRGERDVLLNRIYQQCINAKKRPSVRQPQCPVLDFEEDGEYIYASFLRDYGIDLIDQQGTLSWRKFIALFDGLTDETKIKRVMKIRGMEIPRYDGHNQKQIQNITELKSYYALPVRGGGGQNGLDALFSSLEGMANQ